MPIHAWAPISVPPCAQDDVAKLALGGPISPGYIKIRPIAMMATICDWKPASERTKPGSIAQSVGHNKVRFGIDNQLAAILENTVRELGW